MKNQALFSSKDESKKLKCRLLQFLFGALKVKGQVMYKVCMYTYGDDAKALLGTYCTSTNTDFLQTKLYRENVTVKFEFASSLIV